jgi:hypothetical protein
MTLKKVDECASFSTIPSTQFTEPNSRQRHLSSMQKRLSLTALCLSLSLPVAPAATLATGEAHSAIIRGDKTLWTWGNNDYGQTGQGAVASPVAPTQLSINGEQFKKVACGSHHTVVENTLGNVYVWGHNAFGELGLGHTNAVNTPTALPVAGDLTEIAIDIAAGDYSTYIVKLSGELYACGRNTMGQLGLGTNSSFESALTLVPMSQKILRVVAGPDFALALDEEGQLWAWGSNGFGQLGLGNQINVNSPTMVGTDTDWVDISCGGSHVLGLKKNGDLYAWGNDHFGQTGLTIKSSPELVITGIKAMSAGREHSLILKNSVEMWSQGRSQVGQVGRGFTSNGDGQMAQVVGDWFSAMTGRYHNLALKNDGQLYAWGSNSAGQTTSAQKQDNLPQPVSIAVDPFPMINVEPVGNLSSGETLTLNSQALGSGTLTTTWEVTHGPVGGSGAVSGNTPSASFQPLVPGTYIIKVSVSDGANVSSQTFTVHVKPAVYGKMIWGSGSWNAGALATQNLQD